MVSTTTTSTATTPHNDNNTPPSLTNDPPHNNSEKKYEENSPMITAPQALLLSSIPFLSGALMGYRRAIISSRSSADGPTVASTGGLLSRIFKVASSLSQEMTDGFADQMKSSRGTTQIQSSRSVATVAAKALGIGSLLSVGGVGLLSAGVLYLSGCDSISSLVEKCRDGTPRRRQLWESYCGVDLSSRSEERWKDDEDVRATAGMNEDDEVEFYKKKYMSDLYKDDGEDEKQGMNKK